MWPIAQFEAHSVSYLPFRVSMVVLNFLYTQQKKFLDAYKSQIFTELFHIRQIKSISWAAGGCALHFDTKLEGIYVDK